MPLLKHDIDMQRDYESYLPYNNNSAKDYEKTLLSNGEVMSFLQVQSLKGLQANSQFGLYSRDNFPITKGSKYRLSFLVAVHPNAVTQLQFLYILTAGDTTVANQRLYPFELEEYEFYARMENKFSLNLYRLIVEFEGMYTDSQSRLLIGSTTSKNLSSGSYGLMYVGDIKVETVEEYKRDYERNVIADLPTNKSSSDFFNYKDLDNIQKGILITDEKYREFYNKTTGVNTQDAVKDRSEKTILYADELNLIEINTEKLGVALKQPYGFSKPKTDWAHNNSFSFRDANRIGRNIEVLYWHLTLTLDYYPYTGDYITGEKGVL